MGATFSRVKTWIAEILTAGDLNAEFDNILNNLTPTGIDDLSADATAMQGTADPYPGGSPSLSTSLTGELQRLRYLIKQLNGKTYWYQDPDTPSWLVDIDVFNLESDSTNWGTFAVDGTNKLYAGSRDCDVSAQNSYLTWPIVLNAGTWTFSMLHTKGPDVGIYSVQFDAVEKGTIDGYAAGATYNVRSEITGIVVAATAKIVLKLNMGTKHASSTGYFGRIQHIRILRTA